MPFDAERMRGIKAVNDLIDADTGEVVLEAGKKLTARQARQLAEKGLKALQGRRRGAVRPLPRRGHRQPGDRRDLRRGRRRDRREAAQVAGRGGLRTRSPSSTSTTSTSAPTSATRSRSTRTKPRGRAVRHLPGHASGRAADDRNGRGDVPVAVLRSGALRPFGRRPREDEHAPRPRGRGHRARAAQGGHPRGRQDAGRPARRQGRDRRHRQSRQPPGALGRRADGEPVPHRPAAHGAGDQGAHVLGRDRQRHAAGPDQRQAGGRRGARVLRLLAALAVHGPDQPAVGDHPQAASVGARPGRSDPRARRLRGARRAPDPLRPHLPDRDAGRPEHRPDQLAGDLRAGQQVRLHREPVPQGEGRQGHRRGRLSVGDGGGEVQRRPGQCRARRQGPVRRRPGHLPPRRRSRSWCRATRST